MESQFDLNGELVTAGGRLLGVVGAGSQVKSH
jgi:hypothetical protein